MALSKHRKYGRRLGRRNFDTDNIDAATVGGSLLRPPPLTSYFAVPNLTIGLKFSRRVLLARVGTRVQDERRPSK